MQNPNATIASAPTASKKIDSAETTTVYVGKIPPTVEDDFIRKLLEVGISLFVVCYVCPSQVGEKSPS